MSESTGSVSIYSHANCERFEDHGLAMPESVIHVQVAICSICGSDNAKNPGRPVVHQVSEENCLKKLGHTK